MKTADLSPVERSLRVKALRYLSQGHVTVLNGVATVHDRPPIVAEVKSSRKDSIRVYLVDGYSIDDWQCTCKLGRGCAHILATRLVTDHHGRTS